MATDDRRASMIGRTVAWFLLWAALSACAPARAAGPVAIDLTVTTSDGRSVRLADYRGRWLLVNYWATWCGACIHEMPQLSAMAERDPRLAVLGLTDEKLSAQELRDFLAAHPVSYAVAVVDKSQLPSALAPTAFGIGMRPISYLVAPDGTVVERILGGVDEKQLLRRIDERPK